MTAASSCHPRRGSAAAVRTSSRSALSITSIWKTLKIFRTDLGLAMRQFSTTVDAAMLRR